MLTTVIRHRSAAPEGRSGFGVTRQESQPTAAREGSGAASFLGRADRQAEAQANKPARIADTDERLILTAPGRGVVRSTVGRET